MKRRATRACLCLSPLAFIAVLMVLFAFGLPGQYTETFLGGYADKVAALQQSAGRRIILTGGSGAVFAVRSDLLENEL